MNKYSITDQLPSELRGPFGFREKDGRVEGYVERPSDLLRRFEPIDVLNGAMELVDQRGIILVIYCDDQTRIDDNEYPKDYEGIYCLIRE